MSTKQTEALKLAQELRALADRFSEGWHDGIKIDALDIELLAMAASAIEQPAPQQKPLTDEQITAGAKALCKRSSEICGVNADDNWNLESEYFKDDARCVLEAAHNIGEEQ